MTLLDAAVLVFERRRYATPGAKESAIIREFSWSPTRHAQRLNRLLDDPAALRLDAQTVRRLQRIRAERSARRRPA